MRKWLLEYRVDYDKEPKSTFGASTVKTFKVEGVVWTLQCQLSTWRRGYYHPLWCHEILAILARRSGAIASEPNVRTSHYSSVQFGRLPLAIGAGVGAHEISV